MATYLPAGFCPSCGYAIDPGVCPECGTTVTRPLRVPPHVRRRRILLRLGVACAALLCLGLGWRFRDELAFRFAPPRLLCWIGNGNGTFAWWARCILDDQRRAAVEQEKPAWQARLMLIRSEIAALGEHEWAGEYDCQGRSIVLAPRSGFCSSWGSCENNGSAHGDVVEVTPTSIWCRTAPALQYLEHSPRFELLRVHWQGLRYLVSADRVAEFANNVNERETGTRAWELRRAGDKPRPGLELPRLPEPYTYMIRNEPLTAAVTRVGETSREPTDDGGACYKVDVALDVGRSAGVFKGMKLYATHRNTFLGAVVTQFDDHSSNAIFAECFKRDEPVDLPVVGWRFSTLGPFAAHFDGWFDMSDFETAESDGMSAPSDAESADQGESP